MSPRNRKYCHKSFTNQERAFLKMGNYLPPFLDFHLFYEQLTVDYCSIKVADDWIRTRVLWIRSGRAVNCATTTAQVSTSFCKSKTLKEWENLFSFSVFDYFNARTSVYLSYLISGYSNIQGYFVPNYSSTDYINENDDSGQKRWIGGNLILLLSTSVTRWPDYLFNIWPFSSEKIDQIA